MVRGPLRTRAPVLDGPQSTPLCAPVMMLVLALVDDGRPLPPGLTVLAHVRATGAVNGRHAVDLGALVSHDGSMLLTMAEAADELRLSPRQVERLVKAGQLPSVVIGSARRIDRDDLRAFVVEHRQGVAYHRSPANQMTTVSGPSGCERPETNEGAA